MKTKEKKKIQIHQLNEAYYHQKKKINKAKIACNPIFIMYNHKHKKINTASTCNE